MDSKQTDPMSSEGPYKVVDAVYVEGPTGRQGRYWNQDDAKCVADNLNAAFLAGQRSMGGDGLVEVEADPDEFVLLVRIWMKDVLKSDPDIKAMISWAGNDGPDTSTATAVLKAAFVNLFNHYKKVAQAKAAAPAEIPLGALVEAVAEGMNCAEDAGEDSMSWIQSCLSRIRGVSDLKDSERLPSVKLKVPASAAPADRKVLTNEEIERIALEKIDQVYLSEEQPRGNIHPITEDVVLEWFKELLQETRDNGYLR